MKLGYRVHTLDVPDIPGLRGLRGDPADCFAYLAEIGYGGVELAVADPAAALSAAARYAGLAERHGLRIIAISTDLLAPLGGQQLLALDSPGDEAAQEAFRAAVSLAGELECVVDLGLALGTALADEPREVVLSHACAVIFLRLAVQAADVGTCVLLKPLGAPLTNWLCDLASAREAASRVNWPTFRLGLDAGQVDLSTPEFWEQLPAAVPLIRHVVLSGPGGGPCGSGAAALTKLVGELRALGYSGWHAVAERADDPWRAAREAYDALAKVLEP